MNLKSMPLDKLSKLKDQVNAILHTKVADQRQTLEAELAKLSRLSTSHLRSKGPPSAARSPRNTVIRKIQAKPGPDVD